MSTKDISFEKSIENLEKIVAELEAGDMPLDKMLEKFEEGIKLSRECSKQLEEVEKKVNLLIKQPDGTVTQIEFDELKAE